MTHNIFQSVKEKFSVPNFSEFLRKPRTIETKIVDPTRMRVSALLDGEILHSHQDIIVPEDKQKKILESTDGQHNVVLLYQKKGFAHPASLMGLDLRDNEIIVNQIQGLKDKKVSFQVDSSFDSWRFYLRFLEENFFKNNISVTLNSDWRAHSMTPKAMENYNSIYNSIETMKRKYNL